MTFGKCDNCEQTVKEKRPGRRCILPLFFFFSGLLILAYERDLGSPRPIIAILGGISTAAGFALLVVTGIRYISK
jgi:drug/metabolite transporter (DMT)-like permease